PAGSDSCASASSTPPASKVSPSEENESRIGEVRDATSATRRTASVSAAEATVAVAENVSGSSDRYFGNSPSSSRLVVERAAPARPTRPSPGPDADNERVTSAPAV